MSDSRVRVLIVHPKLNLAVGIKSALDALGGFEVRSFTSSLNALEFARSTPPDAAILDLTIRTPNLAEASIALRKMNPAIKLILTGAPDEAVQKLRAHGKITLPARAREIQPLLRKLFPVPVSENRPTPPQADAVNQSEGADDPAAAKGPDPFERLAKDEPPIPTGTQGGTVREAVRALLPREPFDENMHIVEITQRPSDTDEGQPLVVDDAAPEIQPEVPPTPIAAFDDSDSDLEEASSETTPSSRPAIEDTPLPVTVRSEPVREDVAPAVQESEPAAAPPEIKIPGQRRPIKKKPDQDAPPAAAESPPPAAPTPLEPAELKNVLALTYEQIGTTAAALILSDGSQVLAHSGEMPTQEIEELQSVVGGDWDVKGKQARLRYVTLPTSRQEYVLHTRRTENGYVLTLAFAGDLPVRDIREQSDSVAEMLRTYRAEIVATVSTQEDPAQRLPFTAVWMLENPDDPLTADIAQAVVLEFETKLRDLGWIIHTLNVHADFVYVYCDVQSTYLANEVVSELKDISAEAAGARRPDWLPDSLWADAYMALMPGRELGSDEVQSFLNFTRARLHPKNEN